MSSSNTDNYSVHQAVLGMLRHHIYRAPIRVSTFVSRVGDCQSQLARAIGQFRSRHLNLASYTYILSKACSVRQKGSAAILYGDQ